ncbi:MAG: type III-B CRISPR module-associated protein Cmr5 [Hyphomicrobiales bacterium]|nr:type III-B CRISPR module-associated protein Cmr5 [Hyphomicrobiales bacterium]
MVETAKQKRRREKREANEKKRLELANKKRVEDEKLDAKIMEMRQENEKIISGMIDADSEKETKSRHEEATSRNAHKSLAQIRAHHALGAIQLIAGKSHSWESNYLAYVKALPATIIMSGLGQALATEKAQGNKPPGKENDVSKGHSKLYIHVGDWLLKGWKTGNYSANRDLLEAIVNDSEAEYVRAQAEAMEYLEWLKKFAVAYLVDKNDMTDHSGDGA